VSKHEGNTLLPYKNKIKVSQLLLKICLFRSYDAGRVKVSHNVAMFLRNEIHYQSHLTDPFQLLRMVLFPPNSVTP